MIKQIGLAIVLVALAGSASAGDKKCKDAVWASESCRHYLKAPEIDPTSAMAALTFMAGGLAVLRGRRVKKTKA